MRYKSKKILSLVLVVSLIFSLFSFSVFADDEDGETPRTDAEVLATMEVSAENDNLILYKSDDEHLLGVYDKSNQKVWWSNPINANLSIGKKSQIGDLIGGMTVIYAEPLTRQTTKLTAGLTNHCKYEMTDIENGVRITYNFEDDKITIPVNFVLMDDYLQANIVTSEISEGDPSKIVTEIHLLTSFGAAENTEKGYFVLPDGSGAIVNFNNGKSGYDIYEAEVYGEDITPVDVRGPSITQKVNLPMYGIVKDDSSGLLVVADKGDTCATINTYVNEQNKTSYNSTYFDFTIRTKDEYVIGGTTNPLAVFERRGILVPEISVRYYPVSDENDDVDYVDIAEKFRGYLLNDYGVSKRESVNSTQLFIDLYGAVLRNESVLGFPVTMQHAVTDFAEALDIFSKLKENGVTDIVANYNHYTTDDIKEKVADEMKPAAVLGGKKDFNKLLDFTNENDISLYLELDNVNFVNGNGYSELFDAVIRVSNEYSRQVIYDLAHNVENQFYDSMGLLAPKAYDGMISNIINSYEKSGVTNYSMGKLSSTLYGDYSRKSVSREMFKYQLMEHYAKLDASGSVFADTANAYILPYVDYISNVPSSSSKFDLIDEDIPFYNIVLHGVIPMSSTPINGSPEIAKLILKSTVVGSSLHFDLAAEDSTELKDTKYDKLFYANSKYWTETAAMAYKFNSEILAGTTDKPIVSYKVLDDGNVETVYEGGITLKTNFDEKTITKDGEVYSLYDYIGKEVIG